MKCHVTRIGTCSQHRDGNWPGLMVCLAAMLNPYFKSFDGSDFRFSITKLECSLVVIFLAARSLGSFMVHKYNYFLLIKF